MKNKTLETIKAARKMYIFGPSHKGEGIYYLLLDDGACLASHFCSSVEYARGDLEANRPERKKEWEKRFGQYTVLCLGDDDMTKERLLGLNKTRYETNK